MTMPHLRTDAGVDLNLERGPDGTILIAIAPWDGGDVAVDGLRFTAAEARMVGAWLNPALSAPPSVDDAELRARARATARPKAGFDPTKHAPRDWLELNAYARHMAERGFEVLIEVAGDVPALYDLDETTDGGAKGVKVRVVDDLDPPGRYTIARNGGQRIATVHLGGSSSSAAR